jgi:hypothetical protein
MALASTCHSPWRQTPLFYLLLFHGAFTTYPTRSLLNERDATYVALFADPHSVISRWAPGKIEGLALPGGKLDDATPSIRRAIEDGEIPIHQRQPKNRQTSLARSNGREGHANFLRVDLPVFGWSYV